MVVGGRERSVSQYENLLQQASRSIDDRDRATHTYGGNGEGLAAGLSGAAKRP